MKQRKNIKPILFSTPMVQAILAGTKKQTRRVVSLPKSIEFTEDVEFTRMQSGYPDGTRAVFGYMDEPNSFSVSGYQIGDILWVRETWKPSKYTLSGYTYKANAHPEMPKKGWKPSIHMPKEAARIFLKVTDVRVEELQEITEADAIAEGIEEQCHEFQMMAYPDGHIHHFQDKPKVYMRKDYLLSQKNGTPNFCSFSAKDSFRTLWQSINGAESWERNPLVWVYSFEQIDKPEDF